MGAAAAVCSPKPAQAQKDLPPVTIPISLFGVSAHQIPSSLTTPTRTIRTVDRQTFEPNVARESQPASRPPEPAHSAPQGLAFTVAASEHRTTQWPLHQFLLSRTHLTAHRPTY